MTRVFVAVGSNTDPVNNINRALGFLEDTYGVVDRSRTYRNPAVGFEGEDFLNLVVGFDTDQTPETVMKVLGDIEDRCDRDRSGPKFGPRTMDLDLLLYGDRVLDVGRRHIPRDEVLKFAFVLAPLADIAPDLKHPETGLTVAEHWSRFDRDGHTLTPVSLSGNTDKT